VAGWKTVFAGLTAAGALVVTGFAMTADTRGAVPIAAADPTVEAPATTTTTVAPTTTTAAPAPPPAPEPAPALSPVEQTGAAALELLDYPWEKLGYQVHFEGSTSGLLGKADCNTREIWVYVRPTQTIQQVAFVAAFELGHAIDCGTMTDATRAEWAAIRGFPAGWEWFPGCLCTEDNYGSGDISMVFATWLVPGGHSWRSNLAGPPSPEQLQQLMPFLRPAIVS
jgi:hypothetical protein